MAANPRIKLQPDGPFIEIDGGSLYLGRDCHLAARIPALLNKVVSNRHCRITRADTGRWSLEDLKSTNGTWLHGERLAQPGALRRGDVFTLGRGGPQFEWELPKPTLSGAGATIAEGDLPPERTILADPDGSDEHPFRAGKTPEVALRHERTGQEFSAKGYTVVLGRDPEAAQIVVRSDDQKHVSGRHAEIQFRSDGRVVLRDLGSRNGTYVNGVRFGGADAPVPGQPVAPEGTRTTMVQNGDE
ncbi:MAG: FHA domain-containing protein, partial [Gemmatimonadota bacterium]